MIPIQRHLLEKIAAQWKEAANDLSWFDPRVWQQVFNPRRVKAQREYYQSAIKPDTVTLANGKQVKDFSREQARANYYKDQHTYTRRDGKGNSWQVTATGAPAGYSSNPAEFEAQNNARFQKNMESAKKNGYYNGAVSGDKVVGYDMAQGPDMTKNMPMTAFQREWKNSKLELDKQFSKIKQIPNKLIDNGITWYSRGWEMTGIPTATRAIAKSINPNSSFAESGDRFTPWDKITGKSKTWFQKQQAPKHNAFWRGVGKVNEFTENYVTGQNALMAGGEIFATSATGGLAQAARAPMWIRRGIQWAPVIYAGLAGIADGMSQQTQQPATSSPAPTQQSIAYTNPYGDDYHNEFGYIY